MRKPQWFFRGGSFLLRHLWQSRQALIRNRGQVRQLSFFVQNFMDAEALNAGRIDACSFMVMTNRGPVSMCEHSAKRGEYILQPIKFRRRDGNLRAYEPLKSNSRQALRA